MQFEIQLVHNYNERNVINLKVDGNHPFWNCLHDYYELHKQFSHLMLHEPTEFRAKERELTLGLWNLESEAIVLLSELFNTDFDAYYIN